MPVAGLIRSHDVSRWTPLNGQNKWHDHWQRAIRPLLIVSRLNGLGGLRFHFASMVVKLVYKFSNKKVEGKNTGKRGQSF